MVKIYYPFICKNNEVDIDILFNDGFTQIGHIEIDHAIGTYTLQISSEGSCTVQIRGIITSSNLQFGTTKDTINYDGSHNDPIYDELKYGDDLTFSSSSLSVFYFFKNILIGFTRFHSFFYCKKTEFLRNVEIVKIDLEKMNFLFLKALINSG